jgi:hypothetical protein
MKDLVFARSLALAIILGALLPPAHGASIDGSRPCFDRESPPDAAIDDCSAIISSEKLAGRHLALAYNERAYFHLKKGEQSQALADAGEAIRLGKDSSNRSFITDNLWFIIPTLVAAIGWALTYWGWTVVHRNSSKIEAERNRYAIELEQRKAKLHRIEDQIQLLYGPLLTLVKTRGAAFKVLTDAYGGSPEFFDGGKRTTEDLRLWRLWRKFVLMPIVEKMENAILQNSHLIDEQMPKSFLDLLAHAASYKAVMKNWEFFEDRANGQDGVAADKTSVKTISINDQIEVKGQWDPVVPHTAHENFPEKLLTKDLESKLQSLRHDQGELLATLQK